MKKIIYFTVLLFLVLIPKSVLATCDDSEITRLQRLANNVNYSVTYNEKNHLFTIYFNNLKKDLVINDTYTSENYNVNGELAIIRNASGDYKFNIYANNKECTTNTLISKYINVPYYNGYYNSDLCKNIENYGYCSKWFKTGISNETIISKINDYKKNIKTEETKTEYSESKVDKIKRIITEIYSKYYFIFLPIIIVIFGIPVYIKEKNSRLG